MKSDPALFTATQLPRACIRSFLEPACVPGNFIELEDLSAVFLGVGRAQAIGALLRDTQRLREEREVFAKKRRTYAGYSRDEMTPARSASTGRDGIGGGTSSLRRSVRPGTWLPHACFVRWVNVVVPLSPASGHE